MDNQYQIQLGSFKSVNSINVDQNIDINLSSDKKELLNYDQTNVIDVADLFNTERQASTTYRIYGDTNFVSLVNGLKKTYTSTSDFFTRPRLGFEASGLTRNILNSFDIYLCKLSTGHTHFSGTTYNTKYEILTNLSSFEIYNSGYGKNLFYDQIYSFDFNTDIDIGDQYDSFIKPIMSLYLFLNFKPDISKGETVRKKYFNSLSDESSTGTTGLTHIIYNAGDIIDGDLVFYDKTQFEEVIINKQEYFVKFPCINLSSSSIQLQFKYNPLIEIKLREFSDEIITANISGTSQIDQEIPFYAVKIDTDGNYIWKDILPNGYVDPILNIGVNHPFVNKRHYIFNNVILSLVPNLNDSITATEFANMKFGSNSLQYSKPNSDLNNLGTKC